MTTPETEAPDLLSLLRSGTAAVELRRYAARGLLPLDRAEQLRALMTVLDDPEPEIRDAARAAFAAVPPEEILAFIDDSSPGEMDLHRIAQHTDDSFVLERLVRSRTVADETLRLLARSVRGPVQDALVVNQVRLLRNPELIDALFENPDLTADARRRLNEVREEFFDKEKRRGVADRLVAEETARREAERSETSVAEEEEELRGEETAVAEQPGGETLEAAAIYRQISVMTVSEKVNLAYSGGKEERRILIGDSNKLVGLAVLKSRGLTVNEIESFCSMRHLDDEIFRKIALNREWLRQPSIMTAMARNPKVPLAISLGLVKHLGIRELKLISHDPNLAEGLRIMARKRLAEKRR
ncbi:MAG: hypothetical protein ABI914_08835 [Acidobacteriota bacterium]